jgi:signal transduction histidine kinase
MQMNTSQGKLFVVDDDPKARGALGALAASMKIPCEQFASAEEFLDRHDPSLRGCALIDYRLQGMDGLQLLDRLRAENTSLHLVLVSAYADVSMAVQAMKKGALAVLEKPYQLNELADVLREAIERADQPPHPISEQLDSTRRLLCDLHDGVAQYNAVAIMLLDSYEKDYGSKAEDAREVFQKAMRFLRLGLGELRSLIRGTQSEQAPESLVESLKKAAAEFQDRLDVELIHHLKPMQVDMQLTKESYRMVQELLGNAWRHSGSRKVRIEVGSDDHHLCMNVRDWGVGFDVEKVAEDRFGLMGIRERAKMLGGEVAIESAPDEGTCVSVRIPLGGHALPGSACNVPNEDVSNQN